MNDVRNVIIIGSGPAGYTAAIYAARAQLAPLVFEGAVTAGGALMNTTEVENFPGFPDGIMGPELMESMRGAGRALRRRARHRRRHRPSTSPARSRPSPTARAARYPAHAVILAMGSGYRELGVEGEKRLSGHGVSWCATCDGFFFRNQHIAVVGGGDSAIEEATFLTRFAETVTLVHRRDSLRASKIMAERAFANPKIRFAWNSEVAEVLGEDKLDPPSCCATPSPARPASSTVTGLFVAIGHDPRTELVRGQVDLDDEGYVARPGPQHAAPTCPGVFACGDLVDHTYRQAITAAGSGLRRRPRRRDASSRR